MDRDEAQYKYDDRRISYFTTDIDVPHEGVWYWKIFGTTDINNDTPTSEEYSSSTSNLPQKPTLEYEVQ